MPDIPGQTANDTKRQRIVKASFNLPESELNELKRLAVRRSMSATQVLRQALTSEVFIQELADRGAKLLVQEPNRPIQQIVFAQAQAGVQPVTSAEAPAEAPSGLQATA
jgi:hypothetical protein